MGQSNLNPFLREGLDIIFVGLNPAKGSSDKRHYFSVNQAFWNQLFDSGLISARVDKNYADEVVFGTSEINYCNWSYGITDLITSIAESNSNLISVSEDDCNRLSDLICAFKPRAVILLHQKVVKHFLESLKMDVPKANVGQLGNLIDGCNSMFFAIGFPHGNTIPSKDKVDNYIQVKEFLLNR